MLMFDGLAPALEALGAELEGRVVAPAHEDWDAARRAWNLAVDQRPAAVALPVCVEDVVAVVAFARSHGLRVAVQATGHNANPILFLEDAILLRTGGLREVEVDPVARRARVGAGVLWQDVVGPAAEHGLAALAGSAGDVGVVGCTLGGGLSWLARRHGLAASHVHAVELVLADGRLVRADAVHEPDLFWALRGGGGSFGAVVALEFGLLPVREVQAGVLVWPLERAAEVLHAWRAWTASVPDEVTSVGRLLALPPLPDVPEPLRGRACVLVEATDLRSEAEAAALLDPLRALGPELDTVRPVAPPALLSLHMDPPEPVPAIGAHVMLDGLPAAALDALLGAVEPGTGSPLSSVELRHLGGALAAPAPGGGALDRLDGAFAVHGAGLPADPESAVAIECRLDELRRVLAPWSGGRPYLNFVEQPVDPAGAFAAKSWERLQEIKAQVDPDDLFRANHPVPPRG
jgi:FAD/FMN-containing dehydrogenase